MSRGQKTLLLYFGVLVVYWILLFSSGLKTHFWNYFYSFSFSLTPLVGGFFGMLLARPWGLLRSSTGRTIFFVSAGLSSWGFGSMIWSYYNFFKGVPAPYPSLADVGFIAAIPLWVAGMINLSMATGARFALRKIHGRLLILAISLAVLALSYYLLVVVARGGTVATDPTSMLKLFLDFAYPVGDVVILLLSVAIFGLSFEYFGGIYKLSIISLLMGFSIMYLADFIFSYTTTTETFYNGDFGDLVFTVALFLMTFGVLGFTQAPLEKKPL